ncbi:MAG: hypothetical protein ACK4UN_01380 [Limisphaerales bacterium]
MDQTTERTDIQENNAAGEPQSISDFIALPDYPDCVRGKTVNIGGYTGVVVDIVGNSLKVRSPEEITKSFNIHTLRKLYGPREEIPPQPSISSSTNERKVEAIEEEAPKRNLIEQPDYTQPVHLINEFTGQRDYPKNTFGKHLDIGGYRGVVVEIVKGSLKVRSEEEVIRSYNSEVLKKLYPPAKA